jgi:hypothetical protein
MRKSEEIGIEVGLGGLRETGGGPGQVMRWRDRIRIQVGLGSTGDRAIEGDRSRKSSAFLFFVMEPVRASPPVWVGIWDGDRLGLVDCGVN